MKRLLPYLAFGFAWAIANPLFAQSFPFVMRVQQTESAALVSNGGGVAVNTALGRSDTLSVTLTYLGNGQVTFGSAPELAGSNAIQVIGTSPIPSTLSSQQSFTYTLRHTPTRSAATSTQVFLRFSETITVSPTATATTAGTAVLQIAGTAPDIVVNYLPPDTSNYTPVAPNGTISFVPTPLSAASSVIISLANRGSGAGDIAGVAVSGEDFQLLNLGLLPANLPAGSELRFSVRFTPLVAGVRTGRLSLILGGVAQDITLSGQSFRTSFAYELLDSSGVREIEAGTPINLGETLPGEILTTQLLIRNTNPVNVLMPSFVLFGTGFALADIPSASRVLRPGETVGLFIQAQPVQVGVIRGRLRVGDDAFELIASGSGAQLRFSYRAGDATPTTVVPTGSIFFVPTTIGSAQDTILTVRNTGISTATITNIAVADVSGPFSIIDPPAAPLRLEPGAETQIRIRFRPTAAGSAAGAIRLDSSVFVLAGSASALPPLPTYRFTLSSGNVNPVEQLATGLELAQPFPVAITGTLTLVQEPTAFVPDPSVRFITGAQTVNFTIPANSTQAQFSNGATSIRLQTGSVAGVIAVRAAFAAGGVNLTDDSNTQVRLTIVPAAPRVLGASVVRGTNALQIVLTGMTVTRHLTQMQIELRPVAGANLETTRLVVDLEAASRIWFQSAASADSGGIFTLQLPINFSQSGNSTSVPGSNLIDSIASLSVVLANEVGSSPAREIVLR